MLTASYACRAPASSGSTLGSTVLNLIPKKGRPRRIRKSALSVAIGAGRRITKRESRYQNPCSSGRVSASARRCSAFGASELTRVPSRVRTAGSTVSEISAAKSTTSEPPSPIE